MPDINAAIGAGRSTEIGKFSNVITHAARINELHQRQPRLDVTNDRSILWCNIVTIIGRANAAATRHELHHDCGLPRNVPAKKFANRPPVEAGRSARIGAHDQSDVPPGIEILC